MQYTPCISREIGGLLAQPSPSPPPPLRPQRSLWRSMWRALWGLLRKSSLPRVHFMGPSRNQAQRVTASGHYCVRGLHTIAHRFSRENKNIYFGSTGWLEFCQVLRAKYPACYNTSLGMGGHGRHFFLSPISSRLLCSELSFASFGETCLVDQSMYGNV